MLKAGTIDHLQHPEGEWAFVDVGFSASKKTCGYVLAAAPDWSQPAKARECTYGDLRRVLCELAALSRDPLHLVLEAPLSMAFGQNGNPMGRSMEKLGAKTRYWYVGAGAAVLLACLGLLEELVNCKPNRKIRLFEGFVSFKEKGARGGHGSDAVALMRVVSSSGRVSGGFLEARSLDETGSVRSVLELLGIEGEVPPIVLVESHPKAR